MATCLIHQAPISATLLRKLSPNTCILISFVLWVSEMIKWHALPCLFLIYPLIWTDKKYIYKIKSLSYSSHENHIDQLDSKTDWREHDGIVWVPLCSVRWFNTDFRNQIRYFSVKYLLDFSYESNWRCCFINSNCQNNTLWRTESYLLFGYNCINFANILI